jgi:hypothetical protein
VDAAQAPGGRLGGLANLMVIKNPGIGDAALGYLFDAMLAGRATGALQALECLGLADAGMANEGPRRLGEMLQSRECCPWLHFIVMDDVLPSEEIAALHLHAEKGGRGCLQFDFRER